MKKNIKKMSIAAIAALAMVSCSHEEGMSYEEFRTVQYNAAFVQKYGTIDPNHTWGFGSAVTRAAAEFGWEISSDYDATFDTQYYLDVLECLPEGVKAGGKLTDYEFVSNGPFQFSIIYSQTSGADKVGYYYYNPKTQSVADKTEVVFVDNIQNLGDYVQISYDGGASWEGMGMYAGPNPWNGGWGRTATGSKAKVFTVNVPAGYRVGFFLQQGDFKAYSNSDLNNETNGAKNYYSAVVKKDGETYLVGLEDWNNQYNDSDLDCNDVIMAINGGNIPTPVDPDEVPEETPKNEPEYNEFGTPVSGRIFCEDLGSTGDFDFNDVVFDADIAEDNSTTIVLLAAGGIYDITVAGVHIHDVLGDGIVNTGVKEGVESYTIKLSAAEATAMGISYAAGIGSIPVKVYATTDAGLFTEYELRNTVGGAPQKICVGQSTKWVIEYEDIVNAYPSFKSWVQDSKTANTFTDGVEKYLY